MKYKTIYGEKVEGEIVAVRNNVVIVQTKKGQRCVVHKVDCNLKKKRTHNPMRTSLRFDLERSQQIGKQLESTRYGVRRISRG